MICISEIARMTQADSSSVPKCIRDIFATGRGFQNMNLTTASVFHSEPNNAYRLTSTLHTPELLC